MTERPAAGTAVTADDHELAGELAGQAGRLLLAVRDEVGFADARALKDTGDLRAHEYLMGELAGRRPGDAVLSEEGRASVAGKSVTAVAMEGPPTANTDEALRLAASRVWIVDPLDGTREFAEEGRGDWAVHVALWDGARGALGAGAVALPAQGVTLRTTPQGAVSASLKDGSEEPLRMAPPAPGALRIAVSRSRPPEFVGRLAERLADGGVAVEPVPIGSAGAKIAAVLLGEVDAYVHAGGQYEWDSAAPVAVALAAGAHASRIDGSALTYNREDPRLPDILVCHPGSASTLLTVIREVTGGPPG
ncbi:inositol monophosphatase family protein [Actinomadura sp. SCN-SB]|uniref:inositol monophosphatase family protein n=1 Tax=Actinomadura sp. SCN-SB TaxID=3373092 RepID=UPI003753A960